MSRIERMRLCWLEHFLDVLDRASSRRDRQPRHLIIGRRGERAALFYLRRSGFIITAAGWRTRKVHGGDIDLIGWENEVLCFVEVKTRTTRAVAPAEAAVDDDKRRMLRKMAHYYVRQLPNRDVPIRFDILSVYFEPGRPADFQHFRRAFGWQ